MNKNNIFLLESLSPLYEAVQTSGIFPDSKYFVDCSLKSTPTAILEAYEQAKSQPGFNLKNFVESHFELPETPDTGYESANKPIVEHLNNLWDDKRECREKAMKRRRVNGLSPV